MYVRKKHKLRHNLLGVLLKRIEQHINSNVHYQASVDAENVAISIEELANELKISIAELKTITPPLVRAEEIMVKDFGKGISVFAWSYSQAAYDEKKYIEIGRKKFNDDIYDVVKWLLPIAIITVSICTTYINVMLSKGKSNTQQQIEQLSKRITILEQSKDSLRHTKTDHDSTSYQNQIFVDSSIR